jgi:NAD+ kinase
MDDKAIALACRMDSEKAIKLTKKIFDFLIKKGEKVHLETRIAPKIFLHNGKDLNEMNAENTKFIISAGGDGTILRIASNLSQEDPPPILGVNIGSIGFLDESNVRNIFNDINRALKEDYMIETCSKITPYIVQNNEEYKLDNALNEILVVSSKSTKVLLLSVKVDDIFLNRSYSDGIIVSTSVGSTGYNLSAGGAIVKPSLDIMQVTALNSYANSGLKPIILPIDSEVEIKLLRHRLDADVVIDGQKSIKNISPNTIIKIRKANSYSKFIRFSRNLSDNYIRRLRKKIIGTIRVPLDDSPEEDLNSHF